MAKTANNLSTMIITKIFKVMILIQKYFGEILIDPLYKIITKIFKVMIVKQKNTLKQN